MQVYLVVFCSFLFTRLFLFRECSIRILYPSQFVLNIQQDRRRENRGWWRRDPGHRLLDTGKARHTDLSTYIWQIFISKRAKTVSRGGKLFEVSAVFGKFFLEKTSFLCKNHRRGVTDVLWKHKTTFQNENYQKLKNFSRAILQLNTRQHFVTGFYIEDVISNL